MTTEYSGSVSGLVRVARRLDSPVDGPLSLTWIYTRVVSFLGSGKTMSNIGVPWRIKIKRGIGLDMVADSR